ncbi:LysR family transcriptional regulator [Kibdelosporangium aridum]|uniref:LysR family transcriptional regulator n=1 Tax=Kibdelosporangium aridum TaxID=2030 RepID=UPI0035EA1C91
MLWPAWSLRLALPSCHQQHLRPALSCAVQLVGTGLRLSQSTSALNSPITGHGLSRILQLLAAHRCWPHIYTALIRLADYLDAHHVPIDYQRRRTLRYDDLLPDDEWSELCRQTGTLAGTRKVTVVRSVLFEQISGLPAGHAPFAIDDRDFRAKVAVFPAEVTPNLTDGLRHAARTFLHRQGIHDEPVTWQPPLELLSDLDLPGPNPDSIDIRQLHQLIRRHNNNTLSQCAEQLGTTIDVVRHLLERQPAPPTAQPRTLARTALSKHDLVDLYHRQQLTLHEIGNRIGVSRQTITRLAREYGIQLRPASPLPRVGIDRDWLYEQYVTRRRTLPDLAREAGMSTANMARWAKTHHIPLRPRGGGSHDQVRVTLYQANSVPRVLQPALTGHGAWNRLRRFAAAAEHPTITVAAQTLGCHQGALTTQISRLERDLGGQLLTRAERGRPMRLTPLGRKVLTEIQSCHPEDMPPH